ncbi:MAG: hypothetical protein Q9160_008572 [Pyrenula sp. 1 TL-2023]
MLRQLDATPCPDNLHVDLAHGRQSLISTSENDTADVDFTTEFRASLRAAAPKRRQTNVRSKKATGVGFIIHEDEELKAFPQQSIASRLTTGDKHSGSIMSQPPQRFHSKVSITSRNTKQGTGEGIAKQAQPNYPDTAVAKASLESRMKRPARRGTIYVPTEDTTMPTMFMGVFSPIKDLAAGKVATEAHQNEDVTGIAAQMVRKKASRRSLAAVPAKRTPLQNPLQPVQEKVGVGDRPGQRTGKENIPSGQSQEAPAKWKPQKDLFDISHAQVSATVQSMPKGRESIGPNFILQASQNAQPLKTTVRAPPRRSLLPASGLRSTSFVPNAQTEEPSTKKTSQFEVPTARGNAPKEVRIPRKSPPRPIGLVPKGLSAPSYRSTSVCQQYPLLTDGIVIPSMYEDNWLSHQEVAITQLVNNLITDSRPSAKCSRRQLRLDLMGMYQSESFSLLYKRLQASLLYGALSVPKDVLSKAARLNNDIGARRRFLDLWIKTYQPKYLRAGAEAIIGRQCPGTPRNSNTGASPSPTRSPRSSKQAIEAFLEAFLIRNEDLETQRSKSTSGRTEDAYRRTLHRSLLLIQLLDQARTGKDPIFSGALFLTTSPYKSSTSVLQALTTMLLPSHGDLTRQLLHLDYALSHTQYSLEEYKYAIENMAIDLRDGVRLTRLVEILLYPSSSQLRSRSDCTATILMPTGEALDLLHGPDDWPLSQHLRVPCLGRATKIFNVQIALSALQGVQGMKSLLDGITAEDVVDGYREKTVGLLWGLLGRWGVGHLVDFEDVKAETRRILKPLIDHQGYDEDHDLSVTEEDCEASEAETGLLRAWAAAVAQSRGISLQNLTTCFSDGRIFSAIVEEYAAYLPSAGTIHTRNEALSVRLQGLGCSTQFSQLFARPERIFDKESTLAALTFLASRLLGVSKSTRAALKIQRAWRRISVLRDTRKKIVKRKIAQECAVVVAVRERVSQAKSTILKAWRRYCDRKINYETENLDHPINLSSSATAHGAKADVKDTLSSSIEPTRRHESKTDRLERTSTPMRQPADVAWKPSGDRDRHVRAATNMPASPPRGASPQKDMMSYSRLPSPTKLIANTSIIDDRKRQNELGISTDTTNKADMALNSQFGRSSSLRQPSSRFALGQRTTSQGHGKSNSLTHGTRRVSGLRAVAESSKSEPHSSTHEALQFRSRSHLHDNSSEISTTNTHQRKSSSARNAAKVVLESSESVPSTSKSLKTKPEFSTYQQHFTPKKASRVSSQTAADTGFAKDHLDSIPTDALHLRDELLQLSLLYTSAQTTKQQWEKSAKDSIEKRIGRISQKSSEHALEQQMGQTQRNLEALEHWLSEGGCSPAEKVKILSQNIRDVTNLTSNDGKAGRAIGCFCDWFDLAIVSIDMKEGQAMGPIVPLEAAWKDDAKTAVRAMEMCGKQLKTVRTTESNAAVNRILECHIKMITQTIEELTLMQEIGDLALEQANQYARRAIDETLGAADDAFLQKEKLPQGIWNTM